MLVRYYERTTKHWKLISEQPLNPHHPRAHWYGVTANARARRNDARDTLVTFVGREVPRGFASWGWYRNGESRHSLGPHTLAWYYLQRTIDRLARCQLSVAPEPPCPMRKRDASGTAESCWHAPECYYHRPVEEDQP